MSKLLLLLIAFCLPLHAETEDERFPPYDNTPEVQANYQSHADFFQFKTLADLPPDLHWQDGMDLPEFSDPAAQKGGTFHFFEPSFPPTLRTVGPNANNAFRREHWDDVYISPAVAHLNVQDAYMPGVCDHWAISADHTSCYFKIDPTAKFSNGEPIRADDYFMMFYVLQSPYIQDPWYNNEFSTKFKSIIKYDDLTFAIVFPEAKPDPLYQMSNAPYCVKFYREFGPDFVQRYNWRASPTTGAYMIDTENMIKGRKISLRRVKDWFLKDRKYYRNRFNVDTITFTIIGNLDKAFEAFRKGALDWFPGTSSPVYWHDKMDVPEFHNGYICKTQFYNEYPRPCWGIYMNCAKPGLDDQRIRLGIQYASNVQKVIDVDLRGDLDRLHTSSDGYGRFSSANFPLRDFSVEKARAAFASAGYDRLGADGILTNAKGDHLSFELQVRDLPIHRRYGLRFKEEALKAGLELRVEALDVTSGFKRLRDKSHELAFTAWGSSPPFPRYWEGYHSDNAYQKKGDTWDLDVNGRRKTKPNTNNITSTANPELDKIIDAYEKAETLDQVESLAHQCDKIIFDEACYVPAWAPSYLRTLYWRWVKWPPEHNVRLSEYGPTNHQHWIDQAEKDRTLKAMRDGQTFEPVDQVFEQFRVK